MTGTRPSQWNGNATGTLTMIWERFHGDVPVEMGKVEISSTFENVPQCIAVMLPSMLGRPCPLRRFGNQA